MGISGLLPFLKDALVNVNIRQFEGQTAAVDTYCWIYRGAFGCAEDLAMSRPTDGYIKYVIRYVNKLLDCNIKPIMIFDGSCLPSKKGTELKRKESKETYRRKAAQLLKEGRANEARECFQRCIECTPKMALEVIQALHSIGVDVLVAPYEADAQLAYLNKENIAQIIITEDSDLILFGCEKILYKMDLNGNAQLIEKQKIISVTQFDSADNFERFRWMCILSGCDYLENLPGIGLGKAKKFLKSIQKTEIDKILKQMPKILKMPNLIVSDEYIQNFKKADKTFKYQIVFDPLKRRLASLHHYSADIDPNEDLSYAGIFYDDQTALQHSLGNLDVNSHNVVDNFNPDNWKYKPPLKFINNPPSHMRSIWSQSYMIMKSSTPFTNAALTQKPSQVSLSYPMTNKDRIKTIPNDIKLQGEREYEGQVLNRNNSLIKRKFDTLELNSQRLSSDNDKENESKKSRVNLTEIDKLVAQYSETWSATEQKSAYFSKSSDSTDLPSSPIVIKTSQSFATQKMNVEGSEFIIDIKKTLKEKESQKEILSNQCMPSIVNHKSAQKSLISMYARESSTIKFSLSENDDKEASKETTNTLIILDDLDRFDTVAQKQVTLKSQSSGQLSSAKKSNNGIQDNKNKKLSTANKAINNKLAGVNNPKITSFIKYEYTPSSTFSLNK